MPKTVKGYVMLSCQGQGNGKIVLESTHKEVEKRVGNVLKSGTGLGQEKNN